MQGEGRASRICQYVEESLNDWDVLCEYLKIVWALRDH